MSAPESWWRRYAAAAIARPYERGWSLSIPLARLWAGGRLPSGLAFRVAHRLDAKDDAFLRHYPSAARAFDRLGLWLVARGR